MTGKIRIKVPATTANLGPGFDCLGLALNLYNVLEVEEGHGYGPQITVSGEGKDFLSDLSQNLAYQAICRYYEYLRRETPTLKLHLHNGIPLARGMGSSAAAIIAGLLAAWEVSGQAVSQEELLDLAIEMEGHPDNVAPAFLGGLVVSCKGEGDRQYSYLRLDPPEELQAVVCVPDFTVSTEQARRVLPSQVPFGDAVFNVGRVALLVGALSGKRWDLLSTALQDRLHQPYRQKLVPGMESAIKEAHRAGALGAALSGSGPTIIAFVHKDANKVGKAMEEAFARGGIASVSCVLDLNREGAVRETTS